MKIYFLSSIPCALTVNGVYFGVTDGFERFAEVSLRDNLFVCFSPENALNISFFLNEQIRFNPPKGCSVYLLKDGIALFAQGFPPCDFTLRTIAQERDGDCLATVFKQGETQLCLQTERGCFTALLSPAFDCCEIEFHQNLVFLKAESKLAVFTKRGERVFYETITSYRIEENTFTAVLPLSDSLGRKAECVYTLRENGLERESVKLLQERAERLNASEELLPYAFFECVLIGGTYASFLEESLREKAEELPAFLGEFIDVVVTEDPFVCGLVRKKAERLYEVSYYTVKIREGKIFDIQG